MSDSIRLTPAFRPPRFMITPSAAGWKSWLGAPAPLEMLLSTDGIRFSKPGAELSVDLGRRHSGSGGHGSGPNSVDASEAWMWPSAGEDDVTIEPVLTRRDLATTSAHKRQCAFSLGGQ